MSNLTIRPYGVDALLVNFKQVISKVVHEEVVGLYQKLINENITGVESIIPAYCSIVIKYTYPLSYDYLNILIIRLSKEVLCADNKVFEDIKIPVCYDKSLALDLQEVIAYTGLNKQEIISQHTHQKYLVYMLGFTPGFPYLGGMNEALYTPRKVSPRLRLPKGSVGIANDQTGVYPSESPGGWQIIGRTPLSLFKPGAPSLLSIGDSVTFYEISLEEFNSYNL